MPATASTPTTHPALHSGETDALPAPLGLPDGTIGTGSDDGAVDGDARITTALPLGRYRAGATFFDTRLTGTWELSVSVEDQR